MLDNFRKWYIDDRWPLFHLIDILSVPATCLPGHLPPAQTRLPKGALEANESLGGQGAGRMGGNQEETKLYQFQDIPQL